MIDQCIPSEDDDDEDQFAARDSALPRLTDHSSARFASQRGAQEQEVMSPLTCMHLGFGESRLLCPLWKPSGVQEHSVAGNCRPNLVTGLICASTRQTTAKRRSLNRSLALLPQCRHMRQTSAKQPPQDFDSTPNSKFALDTAAQALGFAPMSLTHLCSTVSDELAERVPSGCGERV